MDLLKIGKWLVRHFALIFVVLAAVGLFVLKLLFGKGRNPTNVPTDIQNQAEAQIEKTRKEIAAASAAELAKRANEWLKKWSEK